MTTTAASAAEPVAEPAADPGTTRGSGASPSRFSPANLFRTYGALIAIAVLAYLLLVWAPGTLTPFRLGNLGKYCCWAIAAVGIGLAWGRGGMLVMGQGVFFGLGGYIMAMHMKLEAAGPGKVPDFMVLYGDATMPSWWEPFRSGPFTLFAILALPAFVAFVLGYAILKRGVKGAYFAILDALKEAKATAEIGDTLAIKVVKDPETTTSQADYKAQWTKGPGVPDWYQQPQPLVSTPVAEQGDPF